MKNPSFKCSCVICKKEYSSFGIDTHFMRSHGSLREKQMFSNSALVNNKMRQSRIDTYNNNPNSCKYCHTMLEYDRRYNSFCNHSCNASYHNSQRDKAFYVRMSSQTKIAKCTECDSSHQIKYNASILKFVCKQCSQPPYTKLYKYSCKFCSNTYISKNRIHVCENCQHLKWSNNRNQYTFQFNIYHYPDLFDIAQLEQMGWVSFGVSVAEYVI